MTVEFKITGAKELDKRLAGLGVRVEKQISRQASRAAAAHYRKELKKALPEGDANDVHIKKSIGIQYIRNQHTFRVGAVGLAKAYAHILEFSKEPGFAKYNRIWTRTFEQNVPQMLEIMAAKLRAGIEKHGG